MTKVLKARGSLEIIISSRAVKCQNRNCVENK